MLALFGSVAVVVMFMSYWFERRSKWMILVFALGCAMTAAYSGLVSAFPVTVIEGLWSLVALRRFVQRHRDESPVLE